MIDQTKKLLQALSQDQILATIPSGLFLVDKQQNIVYWNHEAERITGYSAEEAIGQHCSFLEGIECGGGCALYDKNATEKPIIGAECHIKTKTGKTIVINKNVDYLRQEDQVVGGIESFIDITSQKKLEQTLRQHSDELEQTVHERTRELTEERSRLRSVLDAMSDPAYIVTENFEIDFINQATKELFGDSEGQRCYTLLHDRNRPCTDCPWPQIKKSQMVHEERAFGQNERIYEIVHTPVHNPQGEIQKLAVCRDITERKEAADKLLELNKHLDSFVYTVSHDLRSPLTPIIGFAEFLKEEYRGKLDDQAINLLEEIENQGGRMLNLMEDLLELSRVGYLPLPDKAEDVNAVISQILLDNVHELTEKNIEITTDPLPELLMPETLIYELFSNLILNAVRYGCKPGDGIEIGGAKENGTVTYFISDHGPGIPEKERGKVCNVFFRGTTSKDIPGTGIGLATAHKIARLHNGSILFTETSGGGCTVQLQFNTV